MIFRTMGRGVAGASKLTSISAEATPSATDEDLTPMLGPSVNVTALFSDVGLEQPDSRIVPISRDGMAREKGSFRVWDGMVTTII
jgi:hypothetical protein